MNRIPEPLLEASENVVVTGCDCCGEMQANLTANENLSFFDLMGNSPDEEETLADTICTVGPFYDDYRYIKNEYPHHVVLIKLNDGYFSFEGDALIIKNLLQIKVSERKPHPYGKPIKVCFLPIESFDEQFSTIVDAGIAVILANHIPGGGYDTLVVGTRS